MRLRIIRIAAQVAHTDTDFPASEIIARYSPSTTKNLYSPRETLYGLLI